LGVILTFLIPPEGERPRKERAMAKITERAARTVNITPDISLLRKSGEVNYTIPKAVAELVDNEIDARIAGKKLTVEVTVGQKAREKYIQVAGNGSGMGRDEAAKAMVMAYSTKRRGAIGEFGLGMKTACSNLGAAFEVVTAAADADRAIRISYDEEEFIKNGRWEITLEEIDKPFDHGTVITIRKLKVNAYAGVKNSLLERFGKVFRHFVASGDAEIMVNGDPVVPYVWDTIKQYDTEIDFEVDGKRVRGWAGLLTHGSPKGAYGFDLIRHNRVMIEHEKLGFTAQAGLARLVGELHLDDFPVTNNKTDFRVDHAPEWDEMIRRLNEDFLVDLKRESRRLAHPGKMSPKHEAEVEDYITEVKEALKDDDLQQDLDRRALDSDLADEFAEGPVPFDVPSSGDEGDSAAHSSKTAGDGTATSDAANDRREPASVQQHRLNRIKTQLRNIEIEHQLARLGRDSLYKIWDIEGVGTRKKLVVTTNQDHPIYSAFVEADFLLWVKHNIVEAVAEFFTESTGKTEAMLPLKSDIMKHIGRMELQILDEPTYPAADDEEEQPGA
jgi:hypothetical protein